MKKNILFLSLALLLFSPGAFAEQCVNSQSIDKSDQCVTAIRVAADEATLVSVGHVLVYDLSAATTALSSFTTELGDASAENHYVAGIASGSIVSGQISNVITRGKAKVILASAVAAGEALYVSATEGKLGSTGVTNASPVAYALEAGAASATIDAYITIS